MIQLWVWNYSRVYRSTVEPGTCRARFTLKTVWQTADPDLENSNKQKGAIQCGWCLMARRAPSTQTDIEQSVKHRQAGRPLNPWKTCMHTYMTWACLWLIVLLQLVPSVLSLHLNVSSINGLLLMSDVTAFFICFRDFYVFAISD